jgi:hypothetical protein
MGVRRGRRWRRGRGGRKGGGASVGAPGVNACHPQQHAASGQRCMHRPCGTGLQLGCRSPNQLPPRNHPFRRVGRRAGRRAGSQGRNFTATGRVLCNQAGWQQRPNRKGWTGVGTAEPANAACRRLGVWRLGMQRRRARTQRRHCLGARIQRDTVSGWAMRLVATRDSRVHAPPMPLAKTMSVATMRPTLTAMHMFNVVWSFWVHSLRRRNGSPWRPCTRRWTSDGMTTGWALQSRHWGMALNVFHGTISSPLAGARGRNHADSNVRTLPAGPTIPVGRESRLKKLRRFPEMRLTRSQVGAK